MMKTPRTMKDLRLEVTGLAPLPNDLPTWERQLVVTALQKLAASRATQIRSWPVTSRSTAARVA